MLLFSCGPSPQSSPQKETVSIELVVQKDGLAYAKESATPYSGEVVGFTSNLTRTSTETYQNGKRHGASLRFWSDGRPKREECYEFGSKVSDRQWYEDGVLKSEAKIKNGVGIGRINLWWPDGRIRRTSWIGSNRKLHGHALEYDEQGLVLTDAIFHHGEYVSGKLRSDPAAKVTTNQASPDVTAPLR